MLSYCIVLNQVAALPQKNMQRNPTPAYKAAYAYAHTVSVANAVLTHCAALQVSEAVVAPGRWRYERVEGAGHWMMRDAPDRVNQLLAEFLGSAQ
jgi:pimeloyl-ACP methyl ester carboxylesterase